MKGRLNQINNIPFLLGLGTLLLNDFYLKEEYHNWATGKLSDFCGLFVFAAFWSAFIPDKKKLVYVVTAILFAIWKSPYSAGFIDLFSATFFRVDRVVDATDLIALLVLPAGFFYNPENTLKTKIHPIPLSILSIFSFCATSMPRPTQTFSQPQYVLFRSGIVNIEASHSDHYTLHQFDSITIIGIRSVLIEKKAAIDDDYHKTQILADLDLWLLRQTQERRYREMRSPSKYKMLRDSLTIIGTLSIKLNLDSVIDELNFKGTRLNGIFRRSKNGQLLIQGTYKDGIEDSVWTFYDEKSEATLRKYFRNGELFKTERFEGSNLVAGERHDTRDDVVMNKFFQIVIVALLILALVTRLVLNYKRSASSDFIRVPPMLAAACILSLPLVVLILAKSLSAFIPYSYTDIFGVFGELIVVYLVTGPLFLAVFLRWRLRNKFDLIFYILAFSLSVVLIEAWIYLKTIIP